MIFQARGFQLAKDVDQPEACQDAWGIDVSTGIAVVCDGVSSAMFSQQWACILASVVIRQPPCPLDPDGFASWLEQRRAEWQKLITGIDPSTLAWHQTAKLASGAFSTLLWAQVTANESTESTESNQFDTYRLHGFAIGDSCLFHFRDDKILQSFPLENSAQLEALPVVLGSIDLGNDHMIHFASLDIECKAGDLVVMTTDAIAEWIFKTYESGETIDWTRYWSLPEDDWTIEIETLREEREMRYDDATMLLLGIGACTEDRDISASEDIIDQSSSQRIEEGPQVTRKWWNPFKK